RVKNQVKIDTIIPMDLSITEYKIAGEIARGNTEKEIADKFFVSPKTIHNHTYNIRKKWGARNAVDVARIFILNLDNPKQFFIAVTCLVIQFHIMGNLPEIELRRTTKTA